MMFIKRANMRKMTYGEFYLELQQFMVNHKIGEKRGIDSFIRISYRKYVNPVMKDLDYTEQRQYKSFCRILGIIRRLGIFQEYNNILNKLVDE